MKEIRIEFQDTGFLMMVMGTEDDRNPKIHAFTNAADMLKGLQAIVEPDKGPPEKFNPEEFLKQMRDANRVKHGIDHAAYAGHTGQGEPDDGWRVWEGSLEGQRPAGVEADTMVEYKMRGEHSTRRHGPNPAGYLDWKHGSQSYDIVAYRVVKP